MLKLYENIKKRRLALGLTQTQLADKLGYADKSMIAKIEKGSVDLPQSKILAFAKALNLSPGDLMGWDDSPSLSASDQADVIIINDNEKYLVEYYRKLNSTGKQKIFEYIEDLSDNAKYQDYVQENEREKGKAEGYIDVLLEGRKEDPQRDIERMSLYREILAPSKTYRITEEPMMAAESTEEYKAK